MLPSNFLGSFAQLSVPISRVTFVEEAADTTSSYTTQLQGRKLALFDALFWDWCTRTTACPKASWTALPLRSSNAYFKEPCGKLLPPVRPIIGHASLSMGANPRASAPSRAGLTPNVLFFRGDLKNLKVWPLPSVPRGLFTLPSRMRSQLLACSSVHA